jgi:hypothetical protein
MVKSKLHIEAIFLKGILAFNIIKSKNLPAITVSTRNFSTNKKTILHICKDNTDVGIYDRVAGVNNHNNRILIAIKNTGVANYRTRTIMSACDVNSFIILKKLLKEFLEDRGVDFTFNISSDYPLQAYSLEHNDEHNTLQIGYEGYGAEIDDSAFNRDHEYYKVIRSNGKYIIKEKVPNGVKEVLSHITLLAHDPTLYYTVPTYKNGMFVFNDVNISVNYVTNKDGLYKRTVYLNSSHFLNGTSGFRDLPINTFAPTDGDKHYVYQNSRDFSIALLTGKYYVRGTTKFEYKTEYNDPVRLLTYQEVIREVEKLQDTADTGKRIHCNINFNFYLNGEKMRIQDLKDNVLKFAWFDIMKNDRVNVSSYLRYYIKLNTSKHFDVTYNGKVYSIFVNRLKSGIEGSKIFLKYNLDEVEGCVIDSEVVANLPLMELIVAEMKTVYTDLHSTNLKVIDSVRLAPARNATVDDFVFKAGIEFETALGEVNINYGEDMNDKHSAFYSYGPDGGGLEVRTTVMEDPNMFSTIGRFDAFCKKTRDDWDYATTYEAGTHIHISTAPKEEGNNAWHIEGQMLRRKLFANNLFSLYTTYDSALAFFDTFNPGSRRQSYYGLPISITPTETKTSDARYRNYSTPTVNDIFSGYDRCSLLRTTVGGRAMRHVHWEWRGTDLCMSALFLGLKIELLKALNNKALAATLDGEEYPLWDIAAYKNLMNSHEKVDHVSELTNKLFRNNAKLMVKDLKAFMPSYAYRGLMAWASYVDIVDLNTGSSDWYRKFEAIIIKSIGVRYFVTDEQVNEIFEPISGNNKVKIPKKNLGLFEEELAERYQVIFGDSSHNYRAREYDGGGDHSDYKWDTACTCSSCRRDLYDEGEVYRGHGFSLCYSCYDHFGGSIITEEHDKFTDRANGTDSIKKAETLVHNTFK